MPAKTKKKIDEKKELVEEKATEKKTAKKVPTKKKVSQAEFEKLVLKLADEGITSEKIGEKLRKDGIHTKDFNKKVSTILKDAGKYVNPDLKNLEEKLERLKSHYEANKKDKRAMRDKDRVFSELRKMKKYFKVAVK